MGGIFLFKGMGGGTEKRTEFMQGFKRSILTIFHFWQNGTFEPLTEIQTFFWSKTFF